MNETRVLNYRSLELSRNDFLLLSCRCLKVLDLVNKRFQLKKKKVYSCDFVSETIIPKIGLTCSYISGLLNLTDFFPLYLKKNIIDFQRISHHDSHSINIFLL